jgi:sporulation protein YlmC with PRC-barrel domain
MRLELGSAVMCRDGRYGELADIVVDPITRRVTHLVVQPHHHQEQARLVSIELARALDEGLELDCSLADLDALKPVRESEYLRVGEFPADDPAWDVGIESVLALPVYQDLDSMGASIDPDPHVMVNYDRIPKHEVEIRRASDVLSSDGHRVGHVDGFLISDDDTADIVLEHGHLWGKREIVIPSTAVASVENDSVTLSLTKDEVEALAPRRVQRWF